MQNINFDNITNIIKSMNVYKWKNINTEFVKINGEVLTKEYDYKILITDIMKNNNSELNTMLVENDCLNKFKWKFEFIKKI